MQELLFQISCRHKSVSFCWVPSHVGIHGNELADREAKYAALSGDITFDKLPPSDLIGPIRPHVLGKWQERWASPLPASNKKYKSIRSHITPWYSSFHSNRRIGVLLTRLPIGHTYFSHNFILEGNSAPVCVHCDRLLSVEHVLVHCSKFRNQRRKYHLEGKSIGAILDDDDDDVGSLVGYVQDIKVFTLYRHLCFYLFYLFLFVFKYFLYIVCYHFNFTHLFV